VKTIKTTSAFNAKLKPKGNLRKTDPHELTLAWRLLNSLQGVAIMAINSACSVSYANPYALNIFNLNSTLVNIGAGKLPKAVHKHILDHIKKSNSEFLLQYASGDMVRTLKVFVSNNVILNGLESNHALHMYDITDRVLTELQLRNAEDLLRNLIDASPDLICLKDAQNRWLEANASGLDLFQLNKCDYKNKSDNELIELVDPIFKEALRHSKATDEQAWKAGKSIRSEEIILLPEGGEKILDVIKVPLFNTDGSRQSLVTLGRDITERKTTENNLRHRSAVLDALISCDWLLHSAENWHSVANRVLEQLCLALHFTRATILQNETNNYQSEQKVYSKILHKWSMPGFSNPSKNFEYINFKETSLKRWSDVLKEGNPVFGDIKDLPAYERNVLKQHDTQSIVIVPLFSGSTWWGNMMIERCHDLIKTTPQELGSLMAVGRSISVAIQKCSANKKLHQAKIAFDSASEGIVILDMNACITGVNKGFVDITGYSEEDVLGTTPNIFNANNHDIWNDLSQEGKWHGEVENTRKNGESYQEWITITAVKNEDGNTINYVAVFEDITESKRSQSQLHALVNHDPLTGLPNRRLFNELLDHTIKLAERDNYQVAVLFIDLDRFKAINDSLGHQVGDKLLREVSERISRCLRKNDVLARLGGDEFIVMLDKINHQDQAELIAKMIIHSLQAEFNINNSEIFSTASIGISIFPKDGSDVDSTIKAADMAMYQIKNKGKNNYCFYSAELSKTVVERFIVESQLRRALERNQFEVYYQPQVSLINGDIIGAEALIRWNHPELGIVSPAKFIPVAEETGLIVPIGEWVLRQAALQAKEWIKVGYPMQWIAVNVSGIQIMRSNFADTVYGVLVETNCPANILELEITESTVMQNTEYVIDTFNRIKQLGVRLAIDDFGTGYSSLSNLKRLPLDKIKIDQSFVRGLPDDLDDAGITNAIYAMAKSLGFSVIAEGVETTAHADFLKNMGCEEAQGYLYSKPITTADFTHLLSLKSNRGNKNAY
jgi:diguanylate cyclase (GGDEF)-like protein/PAS domain S-box-containing protein